MTARREVVSAALLAAAAALVAAIATHEWGRDACWPARTFGVLAAGPLFTGTYTYAAGLAAALACLRLLQLRRPWLAVAAAALALGFSPLAFAFLCIALGAVALARRGGRGAVGARPRARAVLRPLGARQPRRVRDPIAVRRQPHAAARGRLPARPPRCRARALPSALARRQGARVPAPLQPQPGRVRAAEAG